MKGKWKHLLPCSFSVCQQIQANNWAKELLTIGKSKYAFAKMVKTSFGSKLLFARNQLRSSRIIVIFLLHNIVISDVF